MNGHTVSSVPVKWGDAKRYRGRCSCGASTHMAYSTPDIAKNALRFTHLVDVKEGRKA